MAYLVVYLGIAMSTSLTQNWGVRLVTQMRVGLVDLIYCRTLEIRSLAVDEASAITLFNADVEQITVGFRSLRKFTSSASIDYAANFSFADELWACLIEIGISLWLLSGQLRVAAIAPAVVAIVFTGAAISVASKAAITQKAWLDKIQLRVATTASLLNVMNAVKMTGLAEKLKAKINDLREDELEASYSFRKVLVKIVVLAFSSAAMAPVASFGMYILLQIHEGYAVLDVSKALTTLALLQLLLAPVSIFIDTLAGVMGAVGCFERIRNYLNSETRVDNRLHATSNKAPWTNYSGLLMRSLSSRRQSGMELDEFSSWRRSSVRNSTVSDIYALSRSQRRQGGVFGYSSSAHVHDASVSWEDANKPILKDLNFSIPDARLTMIIGPVGSGKSTLLHMLLGETRSSGGTIQVDFQDAAYCSQRPWISNSTVRQNILGGYDFEPGWYSTVLSACCLTKDMDLLPQGDMTQAGSNGAALSGGQQARISIARAIYSKKKTMVMDDVLSGLDPSTEEALFASVFSSRGLLKQYHITAILATNAVHRLPNSDHIIVLDQTGTIAEQGSFRELSARPGYVSKLDLRSRPEGSSAEKGEKSSVYSNETQEALAKALPDVNADDAATGDLRVYKYYIESFGWWRWWLFIAICSFYGFGVVFPQAWAQWWAEDNMERPGERAGYYAGIYFMLGALTIISLATACG